eukprot:TRINITY_DN978_c0_g1_i2.p1 TRINITY_DN978_c0_g1~~TRINITY_DN978_c0_g1_i2.p1  ORF type:complete len:548 (-),score=195.59 TRINITY_DN978_c0_g1_i2:300-1943(-)
MLPDSSPHSHTRAISGHCHRPHSHASSAAFSTFVCGDMQSQQTSLGGRVAVKGDASLKQEGVGLSLVKNCSRHDLIVGGGLTFTEGQVPNGLVAYGTEQSVADVSFGCKPPARDPSLVPFDAACDDLVLQSKIIRTLPQNGKTTFSANTQTLSLSGTSRDENVFLLTGEQLEGIATLDISVPLNAWTTVTLQGNAENIGRFGVSLAPTTVLQKLLFNFVDAEELSFDSVGFSGSVLAPNADMRFNNGHLDGSVAVASLEGNVEIKNYPYIPLTCRCVCPPSITFPPYSIFVNGPMNMSQSQCGGALAVNGQCTLSQYSAGESLDGEDGASAPLGNTALVAGDLYWSEGSAKNGDVLVEGEIHTSAFGAPDHKVEHVSSLPIDFEQTQGRLEKVSRFLSSNLTASGTVEWEFEMLRLKGNDATLNTFSVSQKELKAATSLVISLPEDSDAWAVVNVNTEPGEEGSLVALNMQVEGSSANYVLFNFPAATAVTIGSVQVKASLLAPLASVHFTDGVLEGSIFCAALSGSGQVLYNPPSPVYPPCPPCEC